jgi:DNA modification methylase
MTGSARIIRGNALDLPLADNSVDLICTSPPYFGLRSYQDSGEHYAGQLGSEATPAEFVDALIAATREMMRVLKPSGSIWVNLGDKYNSAASLGASKGLGSRQSAERYAQRKNA